MSKRLQAKHKIERRYGVSLWGQEGSPVNVRSYPPGQHGSKGGMRKLTDYGQQLAAKQKLRGYYGDIGERQFHNIYKEAVRQKGNTGENFLCLLERRLESAVYRMKWAPTVFMARQMVNHGHILVNGRRVNIRSYRLRMGDQVALREGMRHNPVVVQAMASKERELPDYWQASGGGFVGTLAHLPESGKIPYPIQMNVSSVTEFYAR